ncbi:uncharacterized protein M437DRAFT_65238 [Aureobasidium melanogenum CBS 110374]|uniref:Uncharacterized protein n=1 Tax=Aureobasidium melanogenum (strain CBS 110374) TaxID=1043003 RepID=A0A074WN63_AURM1|nr:uncharacterized protein M437DRAFT_65238 [Aureobasidium melanogenum CBS 110374]KEQ63941.1 hypothetical protein M437DRAFT_65238 [Aureobasidium melanogenum CBS 110374]
MDRKRKRQERVEFWTAAKCQRLLRPIASRIAPLRRHQYTLNSELSRDVLEESISVVKTQNQSGEKVARTNINTESSDPTWLPSDHGTKCQLKKYSVRHRNSKPPSGQTNSPQACLVSLPTPFKARALRRGTPIKHEILSLETSNSPCASRALPVARKSSRQRQDPFTRAPIAKQSIELQGRQNYERTFELHQGVTDGFSLLLQRTNSTDRQEPARKGVSSLLSMCLRRVPDYIRAEENWRKSVDEDDDTDVSAEVYEELEDLGSVTGHGWSGLREVVIAHGVSLVHEIIRDKLVATETRAELARMPAKHGLHKVSEDLLLAYARSLPMKRPLGVNSRLFDGCLLSLTSMQPASADNETFIRLLGALFSSGRLKLSWLATHDMVTLSSGMIRALASQSGDINHILQFLQRRISQVSEKELIQEHAARQGPEGKFDNWLKLEKSLTNTIVSIITVLTAIVLIERTTNDRNDSSRRCTAAESLLTRLSVIVLTKLDELRSSTKSSSHQQRTVCFTLLASSLILGVKYDQNSHTTTLLGQEEILQGMVAVHGSNGSNRTQSMVERAASFLVDLSRCCGQSLHSDSQSYLENLVRLILEDGQHESDMTNSFLKQWALESSLLSAKISATQRSRNFLNDVEVAMSQPGPLSTQSTTFGSRHIDATVAEQGLRWEEGLCEWIVASPVRTRKAGRVPVMANRGRSGSVSDQDSDLDDSGYLSDNKETPKIHRKAVNISNLLASPDVLGFDSQTPSCSRTILQAHEATTQSNDIPMIRKLPWPPAPQGRTSSAARIVAEPSETHQSVLPENRFDIAQRPAKKRKCQTLEEREPSMSSLASKTTRQPSQASDQVYTEEERSDSSESEMDELAMGCSKPSHRTSVARKVVPPKSFSKSLLPTKRASDKFVDISDDELGF